MADIKQAAKWMQEGENVRRKKWKIIYYQDRSGAMPFVKWEDKEAALTTNDLLADDWEIAQ